MALKLRIGGMVASPTPTVPIASDSIRVIVRCPSLKKRDMAAAAIHPAVPPPTMTTLRILLAVTIPPASAIAEILPFPSQMELYPQPC